jgi:hypothetical protein
VRLKESISGIEEASLSEWFPSSVAEFLMMRFVDALLDFDLDSMLIQS